MELNNASAWIEPPRIKLDFALDVIEVKVSRPAAASNHGRTTAVPTARFAERNMSVERERSLRGVIVFFYSRIEGEEFQVLSEPRGGRGGRVPRRIDRVLSNQLQVDTGLG